MHTLLGVTVGLIAGFLLGTFCTVAASSRLERDLDKAMGAVHGEEEGEGK